MDHPNHQHQLLKLIKYLLVIVVSIYGISNMVYANSGKPPAYQPFATASYGITLVSYKDKLQFIATQLPSEVNLILPSLSIALGSEHFFRNRNNPFTSILWSLQYDFLSSAQIDRDFTFLLANTVKDSIHSVRNVNSKYRYTGFRLSLLYNQPVDFIDRDIILGLGADVSFASKQTVDYSIVELEKNSPYFFVPNNKYSIQENGKSIAIPTSKYSTGSLNLKLRVSYSLTQLSQKFLESYIDFGIPILQSNESVASNRFAIRLGLNCFIHRGKVPDFGDE